ncbi:MAG TPA: type II secretion system F family protein [Dehalococcoidia bacterium]|nr:type II secretion system F family protein [Dehalococcoidia bacterium]
MLNYSGYQVVNLKPVSRTFNWEKLNARFSKTRPTEIILLYRQLALLLGSGIDIITSLELLQEQTASRHLTMALGEVISELRGGSQLSSALHKHPKLFSETACRLLSIGEETGNFESTLNHLADHMEKEMAAAKGVKGALMYPVMAAVLTVVVVVVLLTFVFPAFGELYGSMDAELPAITQLLIDAGNMFKSYGIYIIMVIAVFVVLGLAYSRSPAGRYRWDRLILSLPLIGRVSHLKELARSCRNISLMFQAGMPVTDVIRLTAQACGNTVITESLNEVEQDMLKGEGLSRPMAKNAIFLPLMVQMIRIGEETGNLDTNLKAVAQNYEIEADDKLHSLIGMIQPAMTLTIGLVIGLIALSLTSAMYSIYGQAT